MIVVSQSFSEINHLVVRKTNIIQWLASNTCVLALLLHRGSLAEPGHLHEMQLM